MAKGKWFPPCPLLQTRELLAVPLVVWGMGVTVVGRFRTDPRSLNVEPVQHRLSLTVLNYVVLPPLILPGFILLLSSFPDLYILRLLCCLPLDFFYLHLGQDPDTGLKGSVFISCSTSVS